MRSKRIRILFILIIIIVACIGINKGCSSEEFPKQRPIPTSHKEYFKKGFKISSDSFITIAAGKRYTRTGFHDFIFGDHYRELWAQEVRMPVFKIDAVKGGMKVVKQGGNLQTLNLRLQGNDGKTYVLRSVDKDQAKILPKFARNKVTNFITRDMASSLNPYAALLVPHLAEAAGVYHTNPELYFIPYDPGFGEFADLVEGRVAILEEFPDKTWAGYKNFGYATHFENSDEMLKERFGSNKVKIDVNQYARTRLFEHVICDWDRHVGQWKWGKFKSDSGIFYKPIPRDRDLAFFDFKSGIFPRLVMIVNNKFQSFDYDYGNLEAMNKNAKYLDNLIFDNISKEELVKIAQELKGKLTDSVIESAVEKWPPEVYKIAGDETIARLKSRRDKLTDLANDYYDMIFKEAMIVGSDERERFVIKRLDNGHTSVTIFNESDKAYYHHIFDHNITKEITIYGLNGNDEFIVEGAVDKGIMINIYGGEDDDEFIDKSSVKGYLKKTKIYDTIEGNSIEKNDETQDMTSDNPKVLYFDRSGVRRK